ncbi:MAG: FG-GAP repeat protein [Chloroflexota bacterium]
MNAKTVWIKKVLSGLALCALAFGLILHPAYAEPDAPSATSGSYLGGDPYADLAIGVPHESYGTTFDASGQISVLYSQWWGPSDTGNQVWMQGVDGILDGMEDYDNFGRVLASGDFNGDNLPDLAIGVPYEDVGGVSDAGVVHIMYGMVDGLGSTGDQIWSDNDIGVTLAEVSDYFGYALAVGDFDGDGFDDLAIGAPQEDVDGFINCGVVTTLYGTSSGLSRSGFRIWHQDIPDIVGVRNDNDRFGDALASGDFNGDGFEDLAVGVPTDDVGAINNAGVVNIIYGSEYGLSSVGNQIWYQDSPNILDVSETDDQFGSTLAAGDFNGDGKDDLAIGVPYEDLDGIVDAGMVNVLYGSETGISDTDQVWHQGIGLVPDDPELNDRFGYSLATGDFDADTYDDLAIGVPYESLDSVFNAGAIHIIYGTGGRLSVNGNQMFSQAVLGDWDTFGWSLAAGHFNGDGYEDLAIGAPRATVGGQVDAGEVSILYGFTPGLVTAGADTFDQNTPGILGTAEAGDYFGWSLAALEIDTYRTWIPLVMDHP